MKALINKLRLLKSKIKAWLCSYICSQDEHENTSLTGNMPEIVERKK